MCKARFVLLLLGFTNISTGLFLPIQPCYPLCNGIKDTPPSESFVTEASIQKVEGNNGSQGLKSGIKGDAENMNSKKNMHIRNVRSSFTQSPMDKDIFYTRNTRSPESEAWYLTSFKTDNSNDAVEKKSYYLRNTRAISDDDSTAKNQANCRYCRVKNTGDNLGSSLKKRNYYLRNTRNPSDITMEKRPFSPYIRNTRNPSRVHIQGSTMEKRPFYLRNTRDWFMRNTRNLPVISDGKNMGEHDVEYGRSIGDPEDLSVDKRNWYVRNTRSEDNASSELMPQYNWNHKIFQDSNQDNGLIPFSSYEEFLKDDTKPLRESNGIEPSKIEKRSAGCMLRCIDEGLLHPAQCHSLC